MDFNIVYNKVTGVIDRAISGDQDFKIFLSHFPKEYVDELESLPYDGMLPRPLGNYYVDVFTKEIKRYSEEIIKEKEKYGKILTEEERLNIQLMPSQEEIQKAETTIEILSLLQEVRVI